jgi:DNA-directed RNA polymerase subunit beta
VEFEYDQKNLLYVRIDRKRKFLGTVFLRALGLRPTPRSSAPSTRRSHPPRGRQADWGVGEPARRCAVRGRQGPDGTVIQEAAARSPPRRCSRSCKKARVERCRRRRGARRRAVRRRRRRRRDRRGHRSRPTGATPERDRERIEKGVAAFEVFFPERDEVGRCSRQTLKKDPIATHEEALIEIYRKLRPGDPPTLDSSRSLFEGMFFDPRKYDFSRVGRMKFNIKLHGSDTPLDRRS